MPDMSQPEGPDVNQNLFKHLSTEELEEKLTELRDEETDLKRQWMDPDDEDWNSVQDEIRAVEALLKKRT